MFSRCVSFRVFIFRACLNFSCFQVSDWSCCTFDVVLCFFENECSFYGVFILVLVVLMDLKFNSGALFAVSLKPDTFEGLRFDFSKGLNQKFSLSHRWVLFLIFSFFFKLNFDLFATYVFHYWFLLLELFCCTSVCSWDLLKFLRNRLKPLKSLLLSMSLVPTILTKT